MTERVRRQFGTGSARTVSKSSMRILSLAAAFLCMALPGFCSGLTDPCATSSDVYFPPQSATWSGTGFNWGPDEAQWVTEGLKFMREPSLFTCFTKDTEPQYRFFWDRSLSDKIAVRLVVHANGTATLFAKTITREMTQPPPSPGHKHPAPEYHARLSLDRQVNVPRDEVDRALGLFRQIDFRDPHHYRGDTDGSDWIFESRVNGEYRLADFRDEPSGAPRNFGLYLVRDLAGIDVPLNEVY